MLVAAVFFGMMIVASTVNEPGQALPGVPETLLSGIQSGLRYTRHSPPLRALIIRNLSFTFCASALWALLPVIARDQLGLGAGGYGMLLGFFRRGASSARWEPGVLQSTSLHARHLRYLPVGGGGDSHRSHHLIGVAMVGRWL